MPKMILFLLTVFQLCYTATLFASDPPSKSSKTASSGTSDYELSLIRRADKIIRSSEAIKAGSGKTVSNGGSAKKVASGNSAKTSPAKKGAEKTVVVRDVKIIQTGKSGHDQLVRFVINQNPGLDPGYVHKLAAMYIHESRREGINHDVAFCQMCLETGFLTFTGSVSRYQNNFCGLGVTDAWTAGDWFRNMEEGVRAHIQHLKAYASLDPIVPPLVDPRLGLVPRGTVRTVGDLTGRWASDPDYGKKISGLIVKMHAQ